MCLTSSFQTEDMVALHMLRQHLPDVPVIFLETGYHFAELIEYRDRMTKEWGLNLVNALPYDHGEGVRRAVWQAAYRAANGVLPGAEGRATDALARAIRLVVYGAAA